ncbi:hypothetical protein OGAPHI_005138 [Ogataea philodendri]|uniref:Restriction of telomere capping protein 4 n=1 Tax=Ogataea philodendri TaxID=1378263 RepID=A0A9P8T2J7_9ASCO|nr:uncharacterized protein OGAPHI_005138 [Ogataea philodendri]KAH3663736.1 hypothetical protein OGAPHI_005138 [Ogataea philodendri]
MTLNKSKFTSLTFVKKPRALHSQVPREDTLLGSATSSSSLSQPPRKRSKRDVYIATEKTAPSKQSEPASDDDLLKKFDISQIKQDTDKLLNQLDSIKKPEKDQSKYIDKLFSQADTVDKDEKVVALAETQGVMNHLYDDKEATERTERKYKEFSPKVYSKHEIELQTDKYIQIARDILRGKTASYFYEIAREYADSSPRLKVTDSEVINLPKQRYHGYIGAARANTITEHLLDKLKELLSDRKANKVLHFWGDRYFTRFVLTPEIIARIIEQDDQIDLDLAYDKMESTADYGLYVMDQKDQ